MNKIMSRDELEKKKNDCEFIIKFNSETIKKIAEAISEHGDVGGEFSLRIDNLHEESAYFTNMKKIIDSHLALLDQKDTQLSQAVEFLEELAKEERHNLKTTHINYMACNFCSHDETGHFEHCIKGKAQAFLKEVKGDETEEQS